MAFSDFLRKALQTAASFQENVAEPFLRGVSPVKAERLPVIGKNVHTPKQTPQTRLATGAGLGAQFLLTRGALAPANIAKGGTLSKALGPTLGPRVAQSVGAARTGFAVPTEAPPNFKDFLSQRLGQAASGAFVGSFNLTNPISSQQQYLQQGGRLAGSFVKPVFNKESLIRGAKVIGTSLPVGETIKQLSKYRLNKRK